MSHTQGMDALQARLRAVGESRQDILRTLQIAAVGFAKQESPRKTSNLSRTIRPGAVTHDDAYIMAGGTQRVGYARPVHEGSRPHVILPRRKKALRFAPGGSRLSGSPRTGSKVVFAKRVNHPGNKPNRFLVRGVKRALAWGGWKSAVVGAWNRAA
jgi:hypothetical protein